MSTVFDIANVLHSLQALKETIPAWEWSETPLPVIAAPGWWLRRVAEDLGQPADLEPDRIHGCSVVRNDTLAEPVLVTHDGKVHRIKPAWARAAEAAKAD